jgi:hypothetical protein
VLANPTLGVLCPATIAYPVGELFFNQYGQAGQRKSWVDRYDMAGSHVSSRKGQAMLFVATITHSKGLYAGDTTFAFEASSYLEAMTILDKSGKLERPFKVELTTAEKLEPK